MGGTIVGLCFLFWVKLLRYAMLFLIESKVLMIFAGKYIQSDYYIFSINIYYKLHFKMLKQEIIVPELRIKLR